MHEVLQIEHAGWQSLCNATGSEFYGALMVDEARMILADGMVMDRDQVVASLSEAPPWDSYEINDPTITEITDDVVTLTYVGTARSGDRVFVAVMNSVYVRIGGGWKLVVYQQTERHDAD